MNAELKAKWIAALRSGDFKQATGILQANGRDEPSFCCLGVLCKVNEPLLENVNTTSVFNGYKPIHNLVGSAILVDKLIDLNDHERNSFAEIADFIEAHIPVDTAEAA